MGGWNQAQAHAQFVSNIVDFGMNIQAALDAPRFSKETFAGCDVNFEARIPESTRKALTAMGHQIVMRGDFSSTRMGSGQAAARFRQKGEFRRVRSAQRRRRGGRTRPFRESLGRLPLSSMAWLLQPSVQGVSKRTIWRR